MANDRDKQADKRLDETEFEPDAWERFERAVDKALHTPPKRQAEMKVGRKAKAPGPVQSKGSTETDDR